MSNDENVPAGDPRRLPLADRKELAKDMYWGYTKMPQICAKLDIKLPTLKTWIYGLNTNKSKGWKVERELSKVQLIKDLSKDKRAMIYNMVDGAMFLLHDFVETEKKQVVETGRSIDIKTADKLTSILMNLDKIVDKERDTDDDASFTKPTNVKELQERVIAADPFAKPDVVVVEVEKQDPEADIIVEDDEIIE